MKATSNSIVEQQHGRDPDEHCRPATSTRAGFMEAQGAGIQILMTADLALEMGVPIYAIIGSATTATDKQGRSVPAPGQGILTTAREIHTPGFTHPLLNLEYRRQQLLQEISYIDSWYTTSCATVD